MKGSTHLIFGFLLSFGFLYFWPVNSPLLLTALILLGSLLPDIDERHSKLGRYVPLIGFFVKHRTFFHGILFLTCCIILLKIFLPWIYVYGFLIGFVGHLLLDAITPQGVQPFWPSKLKLRGPVKVGGFLEVTIFCVFALVFLYLLISVL